MTENAPSAAEGSSPGRELARTLGPVGVWTTYVHFMTTERVTDFLATLESAGVGALWTGEGPNNKEAMSGAGVMLASSDRIVIATGIANIWARDAVAMASGTRVLSEAYPGRFVLGMGVSHAPAAESRGEGNQYQRPLDKMRRYLDQMDAIELRNPAPPSPPARMLGALRPRMLGLAAERTLGAHTFAVTVEHTAQAREILGPDPVLAPEVPVVLASDRSQAREIGNLYLAIRLRTENYRKHFLALGFTEDDLEDNGSDRMFDAIVAWGDEDTVAKKVRAHHEAGADHIAVDLMFPKGEDYNEETLLRLTPALIPTASPTNP